ncbi:MAG: ABC transporter substrate-binding protein, partial [Desulfovibrionales bacterium]|nr:ABC transporter substrate-binding protein [Desulfovibrionales bacterium]
MVLILSQILIPWTRVAWSSNVLRMGLNVSGFTTRDPHYAASFADRILADLCFNGLIRFSPGRAPNLEPDLAKNIPEPKIIHGKQTWTFHLKKGIFFQGDGPLASRELTAADILKSYKKTMDPKRSAYAGSYQGIFIQALNRYTVRFTVDP